MLIAAVSGFRASKKALRNLLIATAAVAILGASASPNSASTEDAHAKRWLNHAKKLAASSVRKKKWASIPGTAAYICHPSGFGRKSSCYRRT